ncbi:hypothetical protein CBL_07131 [Carabus blaptoides fortunei]
MQWHLELDFNVFKVYRAHDALQIQPQLETISVLATLHKKKISTAHGTVRTRVATRHANQALSDLFQQVPYNSTASFQCLKLYILSLLTVRKVSAVGYMAFMEAVTAQRAGA